MFKPKIKSVTDTVEEYDHFSERKSDDNSPNGNVISASEKIVSKHGVVVEIERFPINLPFVIRHLLMDLHKTKKMILKEQNVETNDNKILINKLILNLSMVRIDSNCDCDQFRLSFTNNDPANYDMETGKCYTYVNTRHIQFLKDGKVVDKRYINDMDICHLESDRFIKFSGVIEEQNSYSTNSIFKYITTLFPTKFTDGAIDSSGTTTGRIKYYNGSFGFVYFDNLKPKDLLKWAIQTIIDVVDEIESRPSMVEQYSGRFSVTVPRDRSTIMAVLIDTYITMIKVVDVNKLVVNGETKMQFNIPRDEIELLLTQAFANIRSDMKGLINDLK